MIKNIISTRIKKFKMKIQLTISFLFISSIIFSQTNSEIETLVDIKEKLNNNISILEDSIKKLDDKIAILKFSLIKDIDNDIEIKAKIKIGTDIKSSPSQNAELIGIAEYDDVVIISGYSNGYFKICTENNICGYVIVEGLEEHRFLREYESIGFDYELDLINGVDNNVANQKKEIRLGKLRDKIYLENPNEKQKYSELRRLEKLKIVIYDVSVADVNSADGVDFRIRWGYYDKSKVIKYIYFTVTPYNGVGDIVSSRIGGESTSTGSITGPIHDSSIIRIPEWENMWYNNTISCIKLNSVRVEYMDGTTYTYVNELPKILDTDFENDCKY